MAWFLVITQMRGSPCIFLGTTLANRAGSRSRGAPVFVFPALFGERASASSVHSLVLCSWRCALKVLLLCVHLFSPASQSNVRRFVTTLLSTAY